MSTWALLLVSAVVACGVAVGIGGSVAGGFATIDRGWWPAIEGIAIGVAIGCLWAVAVLALTFLALVAVAFV